MELKRRVSLNSHQLDELDESIIIQGITESAPQYTVSTLDFGNGIGQKVMNTKRQYLDVKVDFVICEKAPDAEAMQTRVNILNNIIQWAMRAASGAWLRVNYRDGQWLRVHLVTIPAASDICDWNEPMTMTFRAFAPFWQSEEATSATYETTLNQTIILAPNGSLKCPLRFSLLNTGTITMNTAAVSLGSQTMSFTNLGLLQGQKLVVTYNDDLTQRITVRDSSNTYIRSAASCRSVDSADDIWLTPNTENEVVVTSRVAGTWSVSFNERWA